MIIRIGNWSMDKMSDSTHRKHSVDLGGALNPKNDRTKSTACKNYANMGEGDNL